MISFHRVPSSLEGRRMMCLEPLEVTQPSLAHSCTILCNGGSHNTCLRNGSSRSTNSVAPSYPTQPGGRTGSGDADQFYHIYIFEYCRNKCRIIILVKEGPPFFQLTLSFNMACMPFQHYHLQNIIKVHLHK